ncbi:MAG: cysteine desulfurase NifS [Gammaproteobacteria bacterium]|nr:MAG: cysteine desulfurase NifS [Gammaproteobacteria bacterium]
MTTYLDYNATCPVDERVLAAMLPYLKDNYGNPSSVHSIGKLARAGLDRAREQLALLVNAHPSQVIFTSGGTEANNMALRGVLAQQKTGSFAVSSIEHSSVMQTARQLAREDWDLEIIPVDSQGRVTRDGLNGCIGEDTRLVSVMMANNETGVLQDIGTISEQVRARGAIMHTDAVQAAGKQPIDFADSGVQLMSLSAHKIYGPKGVGALVIDKSVDMQPLLFGGGHEKGRRSGTENIAGIVGFGMAAQLAVEELDSRCKHMSELQHRLESHLKDSIKGIVIFSDDAPRIPNTVFAAVASIDGETLLLSLDQRGFAIASGSACSSAESGASHVLLAMGIDKGVAKGSIRISIGKETTREHIDAFVDELQGQVDILKRMATVVAN